MYVGIDQSYSGFGITFLKQDGSAETTVKNFDPKKYGPGVTRLEAIDIWLRHIITLNDGYENIDHVCLEGYANGAKFGREKAGELGAVVKMALLSELRFSDNDKDCFPTIVPPTSLKKFVLGAGKGGKNEMLLGTYKRWGQEFQDDNASDSYGLAKLAKAIHTGEREFKYEDEVVSKLTPYTEFHS